MTKDLKTLLGAVQVKEVIGNTGLQITGFGL